MRKKTILKRTIFTAIFLIGSFSVFSSAYSNASPVGLWFFNEDMPRPAFDSSGNGNDGLVSSCEQAPGVEGSCLAFNGVSSYVKIQSSGPLSFDTSFSISLWFKTSASSHQVLISKGFPLTDGYCLGVDSATNCLQFGFGSQVVMGKTSIIDNKWHHVVAYYSNKSATVALYLDGIFESRATAVSAPVASDSTLFVGKGYSLAPQDSSLRFFNGSIDNVQLYTDTLSVDQIDVLYKNITIPSLISAMGNENNLFDVNVDADDYVFLTFAGPVFPFKVDSSNIDQFFPFSDGASWLSGAGKLGPCHWSADSTRLLISFSVAGGAPTITQSSPVRYYSNSSTLTINGIFGATKVKGFRNHPLPSPAFIRDGQPDMSFLPNGRKTNNSMHAPIFTRSVVKDNKRYQIQF